ncbi:hypothetical protein K1719_007452 [Acacia pycnantha]|nr:hypothetical protein K1719_007452 [Acacia pycnantha]
MKRLTNMEMENESESQEQEEEYDEEIQPANLCTRKARILQETEVFPISDLGPNALQELLSEIPMWMKSPNYERVDWMNKFLSMWPSLDKAICRMIEGMAKPIFAEYIGKYQIKNIEFETLSLGTLPPTICGIKVFETNENELITEPIIKWARNQN